MTMTPTPKPELPESVVTDQTVRMALATLRDAENEQFGEPKTPTNGARLACMRTVLESVANEMWRAANARAEGWLPIESAPKDGTIILVGGGNVSAGDYRSRPFSSVSIAFWYADHWRGDDLQSHDEWWKHHPTHWQPLPKAPAAQAVRSDHPITSTKE